MRINEVNMAPAKLKKEALTTTVKVGIEFELINNKIDVDMTPDYDAEPYDEIDYTRFFLPVYNGYYRRGKIQTESDENEDRDIWRRGMDESLGRICNVEHCGDVR